MFYRVEYSEMPPKYELLPNGIGYRIFVDCERKEIPAEESATINEEGKRTITTSDEPNVVYYCSYVDVLTLNYKDIVESIIRRQYSVSDELSILRQKDDKPDEFKEYYEFAEKAKKIAKEAVRQ